MVEITIFNYRRVSSKWTVARATCGYVRCSAKNNCVLVIGGSSFNSISEDSYPRNAQLRVGCLYKRSRVKSRRCKRQVVDRQAPGPPSINHCGRTTKPEIQHGPTCGNHY